MSGKPRDCLTASPPTNPDEPPSGPEDVQNEEVPLTTPAPTDTVGNVPDDDAKSKKASSSESESDSGSSSSGSGDSSSDSASSHFGSGEDDANSDDQGKATTKRKVRRKKKPQPNRDSDEETVPKVAAAKTRDHSDNEAKRSSHDSGVSEGATANPTDEVADAATCPRASGEQVLCHYLPPCPLWPPWRR